MFEPPFRWDVTQRSRLGSLVEGPAAVTYPGFEEHLLACCSRVLAFAGDSDLVFVGRSPESLFDLLSGLLFDSSWFERLTLLHFSMRWWEESEIRARHPDAIEGMRAYLRHLVLEPRILASRPRAVTLVDLAETGDTFGRLVKLLFHWSQDARQDWSAVCRRLRLVGLTERKKTSPNTFRWHQHADWVSLLERGAVKNVSVPREFYMYIGGQQPKVSRSYTPEQWGAPDLAAPSYYEEQLQGLRLAYRLFEQGRTKEMRARFAAYLVKEPAMKESWFRGLVGEVRG